MVIWHIETDYVAIAIYIVLFCKAVLLNRKKDYTDRIFSLSLVLGILSTVIDIFSSTMMNDLLDWWLYQISMIIYGLSVPILAMLWFLYTISLIFRAENQRIKRFLLYSFVLYLAYAIVIITNPIHELYFHLTPDMVYSRGDWFLPLIVGSQTFLSGIGILFLLINRKQISSKMIFFLLLFLHFVTAASYYVQIANPGWLIVCSTYAVAFLVCDAVFDSRRRDALYRAIQDSLEQLQKDKEKELAYQKDLEVAILEANRANQAKSEFLSRMSHDIRTPINGIRGLLGIIRKERHNEERVDDCLEKLETVSGHLLSLINDVLDMSKLESGEIILTRESFDLRQVVSECLSVLAQTAADNGIKLIDHGQEQPLNYPSLIGSPLHLRQIILNIVGNAIKYNKPGGSVCCSFEEAEHTEDTILYRFSVQDTGIGISQDFLPILFQPFAQEHIGSRSRYEGTGLGLAIVQKIIDQMGGSITVESQIDEGSTFVFTLPFSIDHDPPIRFFGIQEDAELHNLKGARLLLVEDNDLNLEIAQFILEDAGAIVEVAMTGHEAVELFQNTAPGTYDAILMDIMMPVMDGLTASRAIRSMPRSDAATIPIIAMTANAFSEDVKKCHEAGMSAHLAKPLDAAALLRLLSEYIR